MSLIRTNYRGFMMTSTLNWDNYPNFKPRELACKHCGEEGIKPEIMAILQSIRTITGSPMFISSGYRCVKHPVEHMKEKKGEHTLGYAVDIICFGEQAIKIIELAIGLGVKRIGVHQKGATSGRFVHLGVADRFDLSFPRSIWTY